MKKLYDEKSGTGKVAAPQPDTTDWYANLLATIEAAGQQKLGEGVPIDLEGMLAEIKARYITAALLVTGGNRAEAARLLNLKRTTLVEYLHRAQS